jgi:hypothetical protein
MIFADEVRCSALSILRADGFAGAGKPQSVKVVFEVMDRGANGHGLLEPPRLHG